MNKRRIKWGKRSTVEKKVKKRDKVACDVLGNYVFGFKKKKKKFTDSESRVVAEQEDGPNRRQTHVRSNIQCH